jgi:pectinesterase
MMSNGQGFIVADLQGVCEALLLLAFSVGPWGCAGGAEGTVIRTPEIVVAQDGSGTFRTVQQAFDAVPDRSDRWTVIRVKSGRYREKIVLRPEKGRVVIRAEESGRAVFSYDDHTGKVVGRDTINTRTSASCSLEGDDLVVEGITFENTAGRVGQAVALQITGDRVALRNCKIIGDQDTFFARGIGRIFLQECEIEGTTDFIFGSSIVLLKRCHVKSKKDSYVTAASTPEGNRFGFVFDECTLTADSGLARVYLGRPWRPFAKTVFLRCELGGHFLPEGWHNWSKPDAERTAFYAEHRCAGKGADRSHREPWSRELTDEQASAYTVKEIFSAGASAAGFGADWVPEFQP